MRASFAALSSHLKFVKDHHKKIARIVLVTDSVLGNFAELIASHFVQAENLTISLSTI